LSNNIISNNITYNSISGINITDTSGNNLLNNNFVCFNNNMDIYNANQTNTGDEDRCDYWNYWNENNHLGCEYSCSGLWHRLFGNTSGTIYLTDNDSGTNVYMYKWEGATALNVYFADTDAFIHWDKLQALGKTTSNTSSTTDFIELDNALGSNAYYDNITITYSTDGSTPRETYNYTVYGTPVNYVPVANSSSSPTIFKTGIMWDSADGGTEYDGTQTTVWVVKAEPTAQSDKYGVYEYLAQIPYLLASSEGATNTITIYVELQ